MDVALVNDLVVANHILFAQGVVDAFGHVSVRDPERPGCFLLARSMALSEVSVADIMMLDAESEPAAGDGQRPYLERFIHGEIYVADPGAAGRIIAAPVSSGAGRTLARQRPTELETA